MKSSVSCMGKKRKANEGELQYTKGKFGWEGELRDFCDRMMGREGLVPYVVVHCKCGNVLSRCHCSDIFVAPVFNSTSGWGEQWLNVH